MLFTKTIEMIVTVKATIGITTRAEANMIFLVCALHGTFFAAGRVLDVTVVTVVTVAAVFDVALRSNVIENLRREFQSQWLRRCRDSKFIAASLLSVFLLCRPSGSSCSLAILTDLDRRTDIQFSDRCMSNYRLGAGLRALFVASYTQGEISRPQSDSLHDA